MNNSRFKAALEAIRDENTSRDKTQYTRINSNLIKPKLTEEDIEDYCHYMPSCDGYYHTENEGYYDMEGNYQGNYAAVWGDHAHATDPEVFGLDEGEYRDFSDLVFWTARNTVAYNRSRNVHDSPEVNYEVLESIFENEGLSMNGGTFTLELGEEVSKTMGSYTEFILIKCSHDDVGPVWSSKSKKVYFPADYVSVSNAILDLTDHLETVVNLTHGCSHCWNNSRLDPVGEVVDEYGVEEEFVEDIIDACQEGELKFIGPIQPDCYFCKGVGINAFGGTAILDDQK